MIENGDSFWMVWNTERNSPTVRHALRDAARKEADRLALANPGETFYVVKAESAHRRVEVQRTDLIDPIPF